MDDIIVDVLIVNIKIVSKGDEEKVLSISIMIINMIVENLKEISFQVLEKVVISNKLIHSNVNISIKGMVETFEDNLEMVDIIEDNNYVMVMENLFEDKVIIIDDTIKV